MQRDDARCSERKNRGFQHETGMTWPRWYVDHVMAPLITRAATHTGNEGAMLHCLSVPYGTQAIAPVTRGPNVGPRELYAGETVHSGQWALPCAGRSRTCAFCILAHLSSK